MIHLQRGETRVVVDPSRVVHRLENEFDENFCLVLRAGSTRGMLKKREILPGLMSYVFIAPESADDGKHVGSVLNERRCIFGGDAANSTGRCGLLLPVLK